MNIATVTTAQTAANNVRAARACAVMAPMRIAPGQSAEQFRADLLRAVIDADHAEALATQAAMGRIRLSSRVAPTTGTVMVDGRIAGRFWMNGDGKWSVRLDGFPVAVVPSKVAVCVLAASAFPA